MAVAARGLSHLHIGLFHEDDSVGTVIDRETSNQSHSARVYEEFNIGLIFQHSLSIDLSQISLFPEADNVSYCEENENDRKHTVENNSTSETDTGSTSETRTEPTDESTDFDLMTKESINDSLSCDRMVGKDGGNPSEEDQPCDSDENTAAIMTTKQEIRVEREVTHLTSDLYSYGKQKKRMSKREKRQIKEEKRKVHIYVDPSEIGFDFCITRKLVLSNDASTVSKSTSDEENTTGDLTSDPTNDGIDNISPESSVSASETPVSIVGDEQKVEPDNANHDSESNDVTTGIQLQDDESFFAELGIDINDSGTFEWNDCLDWDGITLTPPKSQSKSHTFSTKSKSRNSKQSQKVKEDTIVTTLDTHLEFSTPNYRMSTHEQTLLFNLECTSSKRIYLRKDRDRKKERLRKAAKTFHCRFDNLLNNPGRRTIYMHHRAHQRAQFHCSIRNFFPWNRPPMPKAGVDLSVAKAIRIKSVPNPIRNERPAPKQSLRHVLHETNVPQAIEHDLASFLLSIQNRDLTPEDYEMLLRLDDSVKAKTVSKNIVTNLKTDTVGDDIANILICVICMEPYLIGQTRKFLPCEHDFHADCIDSWLTHSSQNCPLDGLPIDDS